MASVVGRLDDRFASRAVYESASEFSPEDFRREYFDRYYYFSEAAKRSDVFAPGTDWPDTAAFLGQSATDGHPRDLTASIAFGTQLPEEFLLMTDRFSMAHSLEARVPFLDRRFVELMTRVPAAVRTRPRDLKYLLKKAVGDLLPEAVLHGRKRGFVIPTGLWLRGALRPLVERLLSPNRLTAQGIFRPELFDRIVRPHLEGRVDRAAQVWTLLMFQLWHVVYIEQACVEPPSASWRDLC